MPDIFLLKICSNSEKHEINVHGRSVFIALKRYYFTGYDTLNVKSWFKVSNIFQS